MEYIAATYFDSNSISGPLTITKNSPLETHEDYLWYEDKAICKVTSAIY